MIDKTETVCLGWCDGGHVDGLFAQGLVAVLLDGPAEGICFHHHARVPGNQIARQRHYLLNYWKAACDTDWLLWVDSDIVLTVDVLKKLWATADKTTRPIVTGTYFVSKTSETLLDCPYPNLYTDLNGFRMRHLHPLPAGEQVVQVDAAGFGLLLMHRSIFASLVDVERGLFTETCEYNDFVGEDVAFFRAVKRAGLPVVANTAAVADHVKRFSLGLSYYRQFWNERLPQGETPA